MTDTPRRYDILVIGSGPAGQKAAVQGAKAGKRVAIVELEIALGGACVHRGTIPSKTLRESARQMARMRHYAKVFDCRLREDVQVRTLVERMEQVMQAHVVTIGNQLGRNGIDLIHGRASFVSESEIEVSSPGGAVERYIADIIIIGTGSRPRAPGDIPVDHEHILDSDSILSMIYLPQTLTVLGGGVIGSEYASIFACLGVKVTLIDRADRPVGFMDRDLTDEFLKGFRAQSGSFLGSQEVQSVEWDGISQVITRLKDGRAVAADKMLVSMGRVANVDTLNVGAAGIELNQRGLITVDSCCRTQTPHIYAVGDVAGQPGLASSAMEQGRRAIRHALGIDPGDSSRTVPTGIYCIPEMAAVGLSEEAALEECGGVLVGRARFDEVARGLVSGMGEGMVKLVADPDGRKLLGVHIVGEGATELIHVGQMAMIHKSDVDVFVEEIFNFPTLAEAYRVAALDLTNKRAARQVNRV